MLDPTKCRKCGKTLARSDEEYVEVTGVCQNCVSDDKTEGKVYQCMWTEYAQEEMQKLKKANHAKMDKPKCTTPYCVEQGHDWVEKSSTKGMLFVCRGCGGEWDGKVWTHTCRTCGKSVKPGELVRLFIPWQCSECDKALSEKNRKSGNVCRLCKQPRNHCCC